MYSDQKFAEKEREYGEEGIRDEAELPQVDTALRFMSGMER